MLTEITMPKNGMDMEEGTIVRWLKNVGDRVEKDEPVMEIETDKVTMESECPASGTLLKKLYEDGAVVPVLTVLGYVGDPDDRIPEAAEKADKKEDPAAKAQAEHTPAQPVPQAFEGPETGTAPKALGGAVPATPYAKTLAEENGIELSSCTPTGQSGEVKARDVIRAFDLKPRATLLAKAAAAMNKIDLATVTGTGINGRIKKDDVLSFAEKSARGTASASGAEKVVAMSGMRKAIARNMAKSAAIPAVTQYLKIDMTEALALLEKRNSGKEKAERISVNAFFIKAVAMAAAKNERFRMQLSGDSAYVLLDEVNVGMAVGTDDGLLVPVIRNADRLSVGQISEKTKELALAARNGSLSGSDLKGAVITVSNLGMYGTFAFTPMINPPEASICGVCGIEDEFCLENGSVAVRKKTVFCTTFNHMIINGTECCKFQSDVKALLENPYDMLF